MRFRSSRPLSTAVPSFRFFPRRMASFRINWKFLATLLLAVLGLFFWNEFLVYYAVLLQCRWPQLTVADSVSQPFGGSNSLKAIIIADTHLLGSREGHWFDKLRRWVHVLCVVGKASHRWMHHLVVSCPVSMATVYNMFHHLEVYWWPLFKCLSLTFSPYFHLIRFCHETLIAALQFASYWLTRWCTTYIIFVCAHDKRHSMLCCHSYSNRTTLWCWGQWHDVMP